MLPSNWGAVAACALLTLSACNTGLPDWTTLEKPFEETKQKAGIKKVTLKTPGSHQEKTDTSKGLKTGEVNLIAAIPLDANPRNLIGLEPRSLADKLGSPGFVRRDGEAEVWQYPSKSCILDVFLYNDDGKFSVDYVELRGRGSAPLSRQACYLKMLKAHLTPKQG